MTATATVGDAGTGTVTRYWKTGLIVTTADITGITAQAPEPDPAGDPRLILPASSVTGMAGLEAQFLASMNQLAEADSAAPVTAVDVHVETWRNRYDLPAFACQGRYAGWTFLSASQPEHSESGCLNLTDPRAGSALTAMPGLPWGRQFVILPAAGAHAVIPGWLTCSIVPLEAGQQITVAVAVAS
jgi:hypothetical protein